MPTYTFQISLTQAAGNLADRIVLAKLVSDFFIHQEGLGITITNLRVQGGQLRIDTDIAIAPEQMSHLGIT